MNRMLPLDSRSVRIAPHRTWSGYAGRHVCRARRILAVCSAALAFCPRSSFHAQGPGFPGPGREAGRGFGGVQHDRQVVAQFDKNGDERLDTAERKAAREWLSVAAGVRTRRARRRASEIRFAPPAAGRKLSPADVKAYPAVPSTTRPRCARSSCSSKRADWEQELAAFNNTDVEVPAALTVDGKTYKDPVGVHFRGASSYFMVPEGRKRSLNVSLDFVDGKQDLGGYKTLNLLNANGDPTFLRAVLYTQIASHYIPTPKMNFMRVVINGESWGIYLNAQQFNKDFTRDFFDSTKGARWKVPGSPGGRAGLDYLGERVEDYKRLYEIASKDEPRSWTDLIELTRILNETPPDKLESGARADPGRRRRAQVPGARRRARQQRRLLDARQRLQHLSGRERPLSHPPARRQRRPGAQEGGGRRGGFPPPDFARGGPPPGDPGRGFPGMRAGGPGPAGRTWRRRVRAWRRPRSRSAGGPRRREQGAAIEAARGARAPRPVHDLRARHRRALAGLEDPRPDRGATPRADCRRRQGGHAEAVQLGGVRHRAGRAEGVRRREARVSAEGHGASQRASRAKLPASSSRYSSSSVTLASALPDLLLNFEG